LAQAKKSAKKEPRKPRYQELADDLRAAILRGDYPNPAQFPTETSLCAQYGVSRFTVREALRSLQAEGLIQRRRGSGTVVQPASARGGALLQPLSNVSEILQYARDSKYVFTPRGMTLLPRKLAIQAGHDQGERWFHFSGLRSSRDKSEVIAVTDTYVHRDLEAAARQVEPNEATIFRQLERLAGVKVTQVTQDIQAVAANGTVAAALNVPRRSPCLRILRSYLDAKGRTLEMSVSYHPGERFAYSMHIDVGK